MKRRNPNSALMRARCARTRPQPRSFNFAVDWKAFTVALHDIVTRTVEQVNEAVKIIGTHDWSK